jgi:hypothetical protein
MQKNGREKNRKVKGKVEGRMLEGRRWKVGSRG